MTAKARIWLLLILLLCGAPRPGHAEDMVTEVIDLRYRRADEVRELIRPLVAAPGSVSALQNHLVVRTTPLNLVEIKKVLAIIDFAPRRLLITVKKEDGRRATERSGELSGSVGGRDVRVTVPGRPGEPGSSVEARSGDDRVSARILNSQSAGADHGVQSVQVLEGNTALIQVSQSAPIVSRTIVQTPQGPRAIETIDIATAQGGFLAKPRIQGDRVSIEIFANSDRLSASHAGSSELQHLQTTVSGRLGEWIELGGVDQSREGTASGTVFSSQDAAANKRRLLIKVEEIKN